MPEQQIDQIGHGSSVDVPKAQTGNNLLIKVNGNGLAEEAGGINAIKTALRRRLARFENRLTRVEVHLEDVNAERGGGRDKRCLIELRPAGGAPIAVTDFAGEVAPSLAGATTKAVAAMNSHFGKLDAQR
ncbi:ribosomal subunit interface protein [Altererythrobacter xixiisoli]|uniref:Ribosomal subunit interface protein n=1 Tax=Croceibacterium xixiisoli TaxID=1476466 RepID=A0A6I4TUY4_9SPHN|nr:ribosomal subunit interface protein [Croceibacterium xixiisoli]MXO99622.1 ribosomal subunit interface protein [Croceibacterium xixiisoli]